MKHSEGQLVAFSSGRGSGDGEAAQIDRQTHRYPDHTKAEVTEVTNWPITPHCRRRPPNRRKQKKCGTDLSVHSQTYLNKVARQLNERRRKTLTFETPAERLTPVLHRLVEPRRLDGRESLYDFVTLLIVAASFGVSSRHRRAAMRRGGSHRRSCRSCFSDNGARG